MTFTIERLPGEPIIISTFSEAFRVDTDGQMSIQQTYEFMEDIEGKVCLIMDVSDLKLGFSDLVSGLGMLTRGSSGLFTDPRVRLLVVGSHGFAEIGVKALEQTQYGGLSVKLAGSVEEAIGFCRAQP